MKYVVLLSLFLANIIKEPTPIVKIGGGLLRGIVSDDGRIYQYFGIPYGTVSKRNRFQAPLPPPKWEGIYEAINQNVRCPQKMIGPMILGDEDCLKLNVYTPTKTAERPLPVMVFIHGGCFFEGAGSAFIYGPDFIIGQDVIFVGINYRLNVEGFLCLGIKEAPGNAGIKDQVAALKWIKENIAAFGGDPDNITLFGESAGAVSISYLILSPSARGLFQRAILQSGATIAPWAIQHDPIRTAMELAEKFGYTGNDPREIYKVLSKKTINDLISAIQYPKYRDYVTATPLFSPCVEKHIPGVEPLITQYPTDIIKSGNYTKMPIIIGYNNQEGIYFVAKTHGNSIKKGAEVNPWDVFQNDIEFPDEETKNATMTSVLNKYFSSQKDNSIMDLVDLFSDLHIKYPTAVEASLYARTTDQPIYYYLFKYDGYINLPKMISGFMFKSGASHADELLYLFKPHTFPLPWRYLEINMINRMVTLWTNFAKYSDPTPKTSRLIPMIRWRASKASNPIALVIDRRLTTAPMWDLDTVHFWDTTYTKYRRKHYGFTNDSSSGF